MSKAPNYREEAPSIMTLGTLIYTESISGFIRGSHSGDSRRTPLVSRCDTKRRKMAFNENSDSRVSPQSEQRFIGPLVKSQVTSSAKAGTSCGHESWYKLPCFIFLSFFFCQCLICFCVFFSSVLDH